MKSLYISYIGLLIFLFFTACDDENQKMFDGAPGLHLDLTSADLDSIVCSFMNVSEDHIVVQLPVQLTGYVADKDRTFKMEVDPKNTTAKAGVHYEALADEYVLKKGDWQVEVPVTFKYTRELDSVAVRLTLVLKPSEDFVSDISYRQQVTLIASNLLPVIPEDNWWAYESYFGTYSQVKHRYILSELKLNTIMNFEIIEDWYYWNEDLKGAYGQTMNNFFATHEIYDENNQRIEPWIY